MATGSLHTAHHEQVATSHHEQVATQHTHTHIPISLALPLLTILHSVSNKQDLTGTLKSR